MPKLWLKLFRDIAAYRAQAIGIAVVVMLGIALYHGFYLAYLSMSASYQLNYDRLLLADFSIEMQSAPEQTVTRLHAIPGVTHITGRLKREVRIEQSGGRRPVTTGRILSVPDEGRSRVNKLVVLEGQYLGPPDRREVLLERHFAEAHSYRVGQVIRAVAGGVRQHYKIAGLVATPEYLYVVQSKENLFSTAASFGVMWMRRRQVEKLTGMTGLINEVCVLTAPGRREVVMHAMYADLRRFGAQLPVPQEDQPSRKLLDLDRAGLGQFAVMFPALFLGSAVLNVFATLTRLVRQERQQIGFLRASGLPAWRVGVHYLLFAAILGLAGAIPGVALGQWFALQLTGLYMSVLGIPYMARASGVKIGVLSITIAIVTCALAGLQPALAAAAATPAQAMRSQLAGSGRRHPPAILARMLDRASFLVRVPVYGLFRQRSRTLFTAMGTAVGIVLIMTSIAMLDSSDHAMDYYFGTVRNYDVDVGFERPTSDAILSRVRKWPGVMWAEAVTGIPVRLSHGTKVRDSVISGVPEGSRLQRFRDEHGRAVRVTGEGVYFNHTAARTLGVEIGDLVRADYSYNSLQVAITRPIRVTAIVEQPIGASMYMSADAIARHFGRRLGIPAGTLSGMIVKVRPGHEHAVAMRAFDLPDAVSVQTTSDIADQMDESMKMMYTFIGIMMLFAGVMTVAIVYNTVSANVFERRVELASLRSLGVTHGEVARMLTIENAACVVLGVALGVPAGVVAVRAIIASFQSELITYQFYIAPRTFVIAVVFTATLAMLSQIPALRLLRGMNLAQMTRLHGE